MHKILGFSIECDDRNFTVSCCILTGRQKAMSADMNTRETMSGLHKTESRDSIDLIGE